MNFDHSIDSLRNIVDKFGGEYFSPEEQAAEAEFINKMAVEPKENIYDYYEEDNMKESNNAQFKERLLMEYTQIIEKTESLRQFLNKYNEGKDMTEAENTYLQIMGKQLEAMSAYQGCLYQRIMMIMDGFIK